MYVGVSKANRSGMSTTPRVGTPRTPRVRVDMGVSGVGVLGGDESFFQAHAENTSSLLDCQRETEREVERELLAKLRANLEAIEADKWMYEKPRYS